jgi:glycosyltransferase involved in cell wall biosynthesis
MRVLFVNSIKPHVWRGGEKWMVEMAAGLTERGHSVLLGVRGDSQIAGQALRRNVNVLPFRFGPDVNPVAAYRLRRIIRDNGVELVCTNFDKELRLAAQATLFSRRPAIVARKGLPYIFDKWYYRLTYRHWVDHIVSPSRSIATKLRELRWLDNVEISAIPNGVRIPEGGGRNVPSLRSQYDVPEGVPMLGFVGDLCRQKAVDNLLRAVGALEDECRLILIGDGGERASLEALTRDLKLADRVTFTGHRQDAIDLYDQFDVVVCPSLFEGMPNVVLEAMAAGAPVIASAVDGALEIIGDRPVGLLFPPGDEEALASAISDLLNDPVRRKEMGAAGRSWVSENYSMTRTVDRVEELFERLIRETR